MTTEPWERELKKLDGCGNPIEPDAEYYIQDARTSVGNCIQWWAPNGAGYCCSIDEAGVYKGSDGRVCRGRDTDVPWPVAHVLANVVRHVRGDVEAFRRLDRDVNSRETGRRRARAR